MALHGKPSSVLRSITCHMRSLDHRWTHPTTPSARQASTWYTYRWDERNRMSVVLAITLSSHCTGLRFTCPREVARLNWPVYVMRLYSLAYDLRTLDGWPGWGHMGMCWYSIHWLMLYLPRRDRHREQTCVSGLEAQRFGRWLRDWEVFSSTPSQSANSHNCRCVAR